MPAAFFWTGTQTRKRIRWSNLGAGFVGQIGYVGPHVINNNAFLFAGYTELNYGQPGGGSARQLFNHQQRPRLRRSKPDIAFGRSSVARLASKLLRDAGTIPLQEFSSRIQCFWTMSVIRIWTKRSRLRLANFDQSMQLALW
jgi:hypothetical protein